MTVKEYIQQGNEWTDMKNVPVGNERHYVFIHNAFFEGKELEFQESLISQTKKLCPEAVGQVRVYGGETPDADMVGWIYTQEAQIIRSIDAVREYVEREGIKTSSRCTKTIRGKGAGKDFIMKTARIFCLKYKYDENGSFMLYGFDKKKTANK